MRNVTTVLLAAFVLAGIPALTHAQGLGTIAGTARDSSGAVLPGGRLRLLVLL